MYSLLKLTQILAHQHVVDPNGGFCTFRSCDDDLQDVARCVARQIQPRYICHLLVIVHLVALGPIYVTTQPLGEVRRVDSTRVEKNGCLVEPWSSDEDDVKRGLVGCAVADDFQTDNLLFTQAELHWLQGGGGTVN